MPYARRARPTLRNLLVHRSRDESLRLGRGGVDADALALGDWTVRNADRLQEEGFLDVALRVG